METKGNLFQKRGTDYAIRHGQRTLPGKYYHDPGIYKEELEKIFYKFWIYACRDEEISSIGDYKIIEVGDESIIIVRDKTNSLKAHFNVCSHRGTQLITKEKGKKQRSRLPL